MAKAAIPMSYRDPVGLTTMTTDATRTGTTMTDGTTATTRTGAPSRCGRPKGGHALAVLPSLTHYNLAVSPLFAAVTLDFLDRHFGAI